jgi:hypothetical protein
LISTARRESRTPMEFHDLSLGPRGEAVSDGVQAARQRVDPKRKIEVARSGHGQEGSWGRRIADWGNVGGEWSL